VKRVGAYEAKTHLPRLLDEVQRGETIVITRHGVPVAELRPTAALSSAELAAKIEAWREYRERENITLGGLSLREMIEEGRM